jgi:hypothetical protein
VITTQPSSQIVSAGSYLGLTVIATSNSALSYQWYLYGAPLPGENGPTLSFWNPQVTDDGSYYVVVTDGSGNQTTSESAMVTVTPAVPSVITSQPVSQTVLNGGTVVFSITTSLTGQVAYQWYFNGQQLFDANGGGISGAATPQLVIQGAGTANSGNYYCEAYSLSTGSATSDTASLAVENTSFPGNLTNLSARGFVGTGDNVLIGGFYIVGSTSRTVLIQALGPALSGEGVTGVLQHPKLTVFDTNGNVVYSNTGWGSSSVLLNAAAAVYAQPVLQPNSADSEALLTLPPGGYTAQISGADGGTGVALCAIYQLP